MSNLGQFREKYLYFADYRLIKVRIFCTYVTHIIVNSTAHHIDFQLNTDSLSKFRVFTEKSPSVTWQRLVSQENAFKLITVIEKK